ncbi:MAG: 50S ribosomal protein L18 [bacterium]
MRKTNPRAVARDRRKKRFKDKIRGTSERPRLCVFRSNKHIYAQVVDDLLGKTLAAASSLSKELAGSLEKSTNIAAARQVGTVIARKALDKSIIKVVFDRNGFLYHGRIKALADAAREAGLDF